LTFNQADQSPLNTPLGFFNPNGSIILQDVVDGSNGAIVACEMLLNVKTTPVTSGLMTRVSVWAMFFAVLAILKVL